MALDLSLRRFSLLPSFIQTGNGEPRNKAHFVRRGEPSAAPGDQDSGGRRDDSPKKPGGPYRSLSDLTLSEVEDALQYFNPQLIQAPAPDWLAKNYFCQIPLQRSLEHRPPVVFGRIRSCFPSTGNIQNLEEMDMFFPRRNAAPDLLNIRFGDISQRSPIQSFCIGVKLYLSDSEQVEFAEVEDGFYEAGYAPVVENGFGDLLELRERHRSALPWVYVFGSEWFATVFDSLQPEVKLQIQKLLHWNRIVLNYHPRRYLLQYKSLNDELEFNYGFTEHYLLAPQDARQVLMKVDETFGELFRRGMM